MKFLLSALFLLIITNVFGQLAQNDTAQWSLSLNTSFIYSEGNSTRLVTRNQLTVTHLNNNFGYYSGNDYYYVTLSHKQYYHDFKSSNYLYLYPKRKIYYFLMAIPEFNYKRKINYRQQTGIGSSLVLLRKADHTFKVTLSAVHQYTKYNALEFTNSEYTAKGDQINEWMAGGRFYGLHNLEKIRSTLNYEVWLQQSLKIGEFRKYFGELEYAFYLSKKLALTLELLYTYENIVPVGVKKYDIRLTQGLKYTISK